MAKRSGLIAGVAVAATFAIAFSVGSPIVQRWRPIITNVLCGTADVTSSQEAQETLAASDELCKDMEQDSIVLLKNDGTLPLKMKDNGLTPINVFGYGATDAGFLLRGVGSGSSTINDDYKITFLKALEDAGFDINTDIIDEYKGLTGVRPSSAGAGNVYNLNEVEVSKWESSGILDGAVSWSDTALFVISRDGGENVGEIPTTNSGNANKTYLEISDKEQATLDMLKDNFDKVIVILNTTNTMHTGFLKDDGISACISVGLTGQSGTEAIARVLKGYVEDEDGNKTLVSPSGKTTDIMTYGHDYDPTFANNKPTSSSISYVEDIYYGYKWYETADKEGYFNNVSNDYGEGYDAVVQFPFGHGLSYTDFKWTIKEVSSPSESVITKESNITIKVDVENIGEYPGKDVVELFYTPEYHKGGIEKAEINLLDFGKTTLLQPGQHQTIELTFTPYDLASYDCYDKNDNGHSTYETEKGRYAIKLMKNSHQLADMDTNTIYYDVQNDIIYDKDPVSGGDIKNRFTGDDAYANCPTDGTGVGLTTKYMTRADFEGTFPKTKAATPNGTKVSAAANLLWDEPYQDAEKPTYGADNGIYIATNKSGAKASASDLKSGNWVFDDDVIDTLSDYNADEWDDLLDQMTMQEQKNMIEQGGFRNIEAASIGKPKQFDFDGPAGFNESAQTGDWTGKNAKNMWTAYPSEASLGCSWDKKLMLKQGLSMGAEGNKTSIQGWYAPGVNLHRSAYTARNFEYYSEDGVLSGKLCAQVIKGAKINNLKCYLKHFVCSEEGPNPGGVNTWITEQNLRENYLKPFEIAVKEGGANAMMSAFNRVGANWAGSNGALLNGVLRSEWGFKGIVITDWTQGANIGGMNTRQAVRAGNDLMLNPGTSITGGLDTSNTIDLYCARIAVKNIIYSMIDTYKYSRDFPEEELEGLTKAEISVVEKKQVNEWWVPVYYSLLGVSWAAFAGVGALLAVNIIKGKKKVD